MPMQRDLYPDDWEQIAHMVKHEANWTCEKCGKACREPGEDLIDFIVRTTGGWHNEETYDRLRHSQKYTLNVAHLDHVPGNCDRANLKALCIPCHCRMDLKAMAQKKRLKRERDGQLTLIF